MSESDLSDLKHIITQPLTEKRLSKGQNLHDNTEYRR